MNYNRIFRLFERYTYTYLSHFFSYKAVCYYYKTTLRRVYNSGKKLGVNSLSRRYRCWRSILAVRNRSGQQQWVIICFYLLVKICTYTYAYLNAVHIIHEDGWKYVITIIIIIISVFPPTFFNETKNSSQSIFMPE